MPDGSVRSFETGKRTSRPTHEAADRSEPRIRVQRIEDQEEELSGKRLALTREDDARLREVQAAVGLPSVESAFQEKYDAGIRARYESYHDQFVAAELAVETRLSSLGISVTDWDECKKHPQKIGLTRELDQSFGVDANRPFASLVAEYQRLKAKLEEDTADYTAMCVRRKVVVAPLLGKKLSKEASKPRLEYVSAEHSLRQTAQKLLLEIDVEKKQHNVEEAIELHKAVVLQLMQLPARTEADGLETVADHEKRLTIQSLARLIEQKLDLVRIREHGRVEDVALQSELARHAGKAEQADILSAKLQRHLKELAPLYIVNQASRAPDVIDTRAHYHLTREWYRLREQWYKDRSKGPEQAAEMDRAALEVRRLRAEAYPYGVALAAAPIEVYARGA